MRDPQEDEMLVEKKDQYSKIKTREVTVKTGKAYSCKICEKFFKDADFVAKHIKNKHADVLSEKFDLEHFRTIARDNYLQDQNRISYAQPKDGNDYVPREPSMRGRGGFQQRGGRGGFGRHEHRDWNAGHENEMVIESGMNRPIEEYQDLDDPQFATSSTSYSQAPKKLPFLAATPAV